MSAQEFGTWLAFNAQTPIGEWAKYLRTGMVCATVANYAGKMRGKNAASATPEDFMPRLPGTKEAEEETPLHWLRSLDR